MRGPKEQLILLLGYDQPQEKARYKTQYDLKKKNNQIK